VGPKAILTDGVTGLLCRARDVRSLADTLVRLLSDPDLASEPHWLPSCVVHDWRCGRGPELAEQEQIVDDLTAPPHTSGHPTAEWLSIRPTKSGGTAAAKLRGTLVMSQPQLALPAERPPSRRPARRNVICESAARRSRQEIATEAVGARPATMRRRFAEDVFRPCLYESECVARTFSSSSPVWHRRPPLRSPVCSSARRFRRWTFAAGRLRDGGRSAGRASCGCEHDQCSRSLAAAVPPLFVGLMHEPLPRSDGRSVRCCRKVIYRSALLRELRAAPRNANRDHTRGKPMRFRSQVRSDNSRTSVSARSAHVSSSATVAP